MCFFICIRVAPLEGTGWFGEARIFGPLSIFALERPIPPSVDVPSVGKVNPCDTSILY